jgi:hypothetical protein
MAVFSWDIVNGDSTIEFAMDCLTAAGIGPLNYAERRQLFAVVLIHSNEGVWVGRHSPEEYREFWACLDAAADEREALEAHLPALLDLTNNVQNLTDTSGRQCSSLLQNCCIIIPECFL